MRRFLSGSHRQSRLIGSARIQLFLVAILTVSLVLGVASRTVLAANHNDPVEACYNAENGNLRHITTGECRKSELRLSWPSMSDLAHLEAALNAAVLAAEEAIEAEAAAREAADIDEATDRQAADDVLQTQLNAIVARVDSLEAENTAQDATIEDLEIRLAQEIRDREAGDISIQESIIAQILAEREQRERASESILGQLVAERQERTSEIGRVESVAAKLWEAIQLILGDAFGTAADKLQSIATAVGHVASDVVDNLSTKFENVLARIQDIWDNLWCFFSPDC